ncbi:hypothetical protein [Methylobacterium sp. J-068]|uniref:hypothetical protein n=1 Tax=Methylobacterium sp. J-068 TaxID=2836649 RepID=UPI001FBB67B9|nr:hypothetical protein [Methylobacterium sp. J-068]MCJ2034243.1 hypothetical protein [Methylobacterium sp. J-068]
MLSDEVDPYPSGPPGDAIRLVAARHHRHTEDDMRLREKGKKDGEIINLDWDAAQAALLAGTHVSAEAEGGDGDRGPDVPAAQSPKPDSEPVAEDDKRLPKRS